MNRLDVYDPALCCATGVCGPGVDETLAQFASALEALRERGVTVSRYNLGQQPGAFAGNATVREALEREGVSCLPLVLSDGEILSRGRYPGRAELGLARRAVAVAVAAAPCCAPAASGAGSKCC
jgi:hypothetical protein